MPYNQKIQESNNYPVVSGFKVDFLINLDPIIQFVFSSESMSVSCRSNGGSNLLYFCAFSGSN